MFPASNTGNTSFLNGRCSTTSTDHIRSFYFIMPKTREQKAEVVDKLIDGLGKSKSAVFVNFDGLTANEIVDFRRKLREQNLGYVVAKKTLLRIALDKANLSEISLDGFQRGVGTVIGLEDEVAPAQVVDTFAQEHEQLAILGGIMNTNEPGQKTLTVDSVKALAKLPSKQMLLAQVVRTINAPVSGFVNVLAGNVRGLVTALSAIKDKKPAT